MTVILFTRLVLAATLACAIYAVWLKASDRRAARRREEQRVLRGFDQLRTIPAPPRPQSIGARPHRTAPRPYLLLVWPTRDWPVPVGAAVAQRWADVT